MTNDNEQETEAEKLARFKLLLEPALGALSLSDLRHLIKEIEERVTGAIIPPVAD